MTDRRALTIISGVVQELPAGDTVAGTRAFVQSAAPTSPPDTYLWAQTELGVSGTDVTLWVEDGT